MTEGGKVARFAALLVLACGLTAFTGAAAAQPPAGKAAGETGAAAASAAPRAVVELFTSQGCSSCPAADALLTKLASRDDILAISMSVDLWDYLGWKDTLAQSKFTERQKAYARVLGDGMVYTPQMVINGRAHVNGSDAFKIDRAIDKTAGAFSSTRVPVRVATKDGRLKIEVGTAPEGGAKEATVWLAVISKSIEVPIARGENRGKVITYSNVVRDLMPVGTWHGKPMTVDLDLHTFMHQQAERCAVLVQHGRGGPIIGAALSNL